jgi:hypothetical protein
MKLTSKQKMLAVIALIVVVILAAVLLVVVPKFGELAQLDADLQAAADQVTQTQTLVAQLEQAKSNASLTQAELLALANQMPENPELPSVLIELQDVSNSAGVRFERITPGEAVGDPTGRFKEIALCRGERQVGRRPRLREAHQQHDPRDPHDRRGPRTHSAERGDHRGRGARREGHAQHARVRNDPPRRSGGGASGRTPDAAIDAPGRTD